MGVFCIDSVDIDTLNALSSTLTVRIATLGSLQCFKHPM